MNEIDSPRRLASMILLHAHNTRSEVHITRHYDFSALAEGPIEDADVFMKVFRSLKLLARLNPWPAAPVEESYVDVGLGGTSSPIQYYRFAVNFVTTKNREEIVISAPVLRDGAI